MNTANLQLEGLLLAVAALVDALKAKGLVTEADVDAALATAERAATRDPRRPAGLTPANVDAVLFPIRFLRLAAGDPEGSKRSFSAVASLVGATKPD